MCAFVVCVTAKTEIDKKTERQTRQGKEREREKRETTNRETEKGSRRESDRRNVLQRCLQTFTCKHVKMYVELTFNIHRKLTENCWMRSKSAAVMAHEVDLFTLSRLLSGVLIFEKKTSCLKEVPPLTKKSVTVLIFIGGKKISNLGFSRIIPPSPES